MVTIESYPGTWALVRGMEKNIFAALDYRLGTLLLVSLLIGAARIWPWIDIFTAHGPLRWLCVASVCVGMELHVDLLRARKWSCRCLAYAPLVPLLELMIRRRGSLLTKLLGGVAWRGTWYRLAESRRAHRAVATKR